jgi:hypothetical protein
MRQPDHALIPHPRRSSRIGRLFSTGGSLHGICMNQAILYACGVINALFAVFHVLLGWNLSHLSSLTPGVRARLQALNVGGLLMIVFLTAPNVSSGRATGAGPAMDPRE